MRKGLWLKGNGRKKRRKLNGKKHISQGR